MAAVLVIYRVPMRVGRMVRAGESSLPWLAPFFWGAGHNAALSQSFWLQRAMYIAAAALVLALAIPPRRGKGQGVKVVPASGSSAL